MKPPIDGVTAITMILIASFAIDRIVTVLMFLLSLVHLAPEREAEKRYKLMYFVLAGVLGIFVLAFYGQVRVLTALGLKVSPALDILLTGIVVVGGADRIASLLKVPVPGEAAEKPQPQPIQITGKLVLEGEAAPKVMRAG